ncbi:ParB/RepB/Spo0J family partition protein [Pseudonocardia sichuanensis]
MSPRPPRSRPGGSSPLVPTVQPLTVGAPDPSPSALTGEALRVGLAAVAPNPLNRRDVHAHPAAIAELAASLSEFGQMKASTVVTQAAFVAIFPELTDKVRDVEYVQVDGARRRAAVEHAGGSDLAVTVDDSYASGRVRFIRATVAENLDREDLNPVEEAEQIAVLVAEVGTQAAAAEQLRKTGAWVTQRLNLLRLIPEVQAAVRTGEMTVREVRDLHRADPPEQLAALRRSQAAMAARERRDQQADQPRSPRPSRTAAPYLSLRENRAKVAARLRAEVPAEDRHKLAEDLHALAEDLLREDGMSAE